MFVRTTRVQSDEDQSTTGSVLAVGLSSEVEERLRAYYGHDNTLPIVAVTPATALETAESLELRVVYVGIAEASDAECDLVRDLQRVAERCDVKVIAVVLAADEAAIARLRSAGIGSFTSEQALLRWSLSVKAGAITPAESP